MTLTNRDRNILMAIVPLLIIVGYWFLLLSPQRKEAARTSDEVAKQEKRRDAAEGQLSQLRAAKNDFASDYTRLVRLGKAVPTSVDMPSLMVQLDASARGTGIKFTTIKTGERETTPASTSSSGAGGSGGTAQSGPGRARDAAQGAGAASDQRNNAAEQSGVQAGDAQTSTSARQGGLPVGGGAPAGGGSATQSSGVQGLESVPLEFQFDGSFFDLADFFHRLKRYVTLRNRRLSIKGRLITIDSVKFSSDPQTFPVLKAEVKASVWLVPKSEGPTAGATPAGPGTTPASTSNPTGTSP